MRVTLDDVDSWSYKEEMKNRKVISLHIQGYHIPLSQITPLELVIVSGRASNVKILKISKKLALGRKIDA